MYQKLTEKIAGKPEERILSYLMLRSLKQARYSEENLGHFALAAKTYTHFTSPIRRYPDLIVHRILKKSYAILQNVGKGRFRLEYRESTTPAAAALRPGQSEESTLPPNRLEVRSPSKSFMTLPKSPAKLSGVLTRLNAS